MSDLIPDNTKIAIRILKDIVEHGVPKVMHYQGEDCIKQCIAGVLTLVDELHRTVNSIEPYLNARKNLESCLADLKKLSEDNHH